jgi:aquaporin Z
MKFILQKSIAELIGTYGLVFFGTGAIVVDELYGGIITHVGVSISFGIVVMAMIYSFGEFSGAHINPAVTIGFWVAGKFPAKAVIPYLSAQIAGGILASATLYLLYPDHPDLGSTLPSGSALQSFVIEFILTFFLMLVILRVSHGSKETGTMAAIAIGGTVLIEALVGGPISGASMNPARSIGPGLVSTHVQSLWLYIAAPIVGAILAVWINQFLNHQSKHD